MDNIDSTRLLVESNSYTTKIHIQNYNIKDLARFTKYSCFIIKSFKNPLTGYQYN